MQSNAAMKMAHCRMNTEMTTPKITVSASATVIICVRHPVPRSRMSILQKWRQSTRAIPHSISITWKIIHVALATEEDAVSVRPRNTFPFPKSRRNLSPSAPSAFSPLASSS